MANRFPLIVDPDNLNIKELPAGDNLDLTGSNIINDLSIITIPSTTGTLLTNTDIDIIVQSYDANLTTWSSKTAPSGDIVGTTDTQTITNKTLGATELSGTLSMADNIVDQAVLQDYAIQGVAVGNVGATRTFDLETGNFFSATLDQASMFTFSNPVASGDFCGFIMELTNGGAFTITWPASVDWPGGTPPTLTAAGVDQLVFTTRDGGTTWFGLVAGLDIK
jgi:hypothetical protein